MSSVESWILAYLLNSLWQVPLLFTAGWLAVRALKPVGVAAEHRVWVIVLLLQALLPAFSTLPQAWFSRVFSGFNSLLDWFSHAPRAAEPQVSIIMGSGSPLGALHLPAALLSAIAITYSTATTFFAARFLWRCHRLQALRRESSTLIALTGEAAHYWAQCLKRFKIDEVSIASSSRIRGPVTIGLARKLLLLPAGMAASLLEADLRTVIAHEFAHMRRNDFLKNLIYELLSLPARYHPVFRFTRERIMETREVVCDQMAAQIDGRNEYARSLLRLASLLVTGMPIRTPHAIGIFDANAFERRLMKLTEKQKEIRGARRFVIVTACAALGVATCGSALALRMTVDAVAIPSDDTKPQTAETPTIPPGEMARNVLSKVSPKYPEEAKKQRIQGTVLLSAVVGKDGTIEKLTVVSGPKELQQSALDAVRQWSYKPYLLKGDPIEVKTTISVGAGDIEGMSCGITPISCHNLSVVLRTEGGPHA